MASSETPNSVRVRVPGHVVRHYASLLLFAAMLLPFFILFALPAIVLAAKGSAHQQFVKLAAENNGVVKLDTKTFDLITSSQRDWSASILFTALDKRRKCTPCRWVSSVFSPYSHLNEYAGILPRPGQP